MSIKQSQFRNVIQWGAPSRGQLFWRYDHPTDEIKDASVLILQPGQGCILTSGGAVVDTLIEPGTYDLETSNKPFITTLKNFFRLRDGSADKVGIWFFKLTELQNLRWGTRVPIAYTDPFYTFPILLSAHGNYSVTIRDPADFFARVIGGQNFYTASELREVVLGRIYQPIADFLANAAFGFRDIDANLETIASVARERTRDIFRGLGFELTDFRIEGTRFDPETLQRIGEVSDVQADVLKARLAGIDYTEQERLRAMRDAARNEGAAGLAVGMATGQGIAGQVPMPAPQPAAPPPQPAAPADEDADIAALKKLKRLYEAELIDESEYKAKKAEVLERM